MTPKLTRTSLFSVVGVSGATLIVLAALAGLAQTTGASQQSGKSHVEQASLMASAPQGSGPMDAGPLMFLPAVNY